VSTWTSWSANAAHSFRATITDIALPGDGGAIFRKAHMQEKTLDVAALGEAMVEFNQTSAGQPQFLQGFGGDTSNAAIAAARAGARSAYLTRVGGDTFGQMLLQLWACEGVNTSGVTTSGASHTGIYFVTHGTHGHEFSYRRADSAASRMTPQWLAGAPSEVIRGARYLHVSAISMAISPGACDTVFEAMELARESGTQVAFDSNLRLKLWPLARAQACVRQAIGLCDIFLPSLEDMVALTGLREPRSIVDWSHAQGARAVVLKLGADGALVSNGQVREHIAARKVSVRDATGAGDCFCGNLLARMAKGDSLLQATRYANTAASLAVQGFGAVQPLPRSSSVFAAL
jgi:2-dehydro-3-deoxygluconokinase